MKVRLILFLLSITCTATANDADIVIDNLRYDWMIVDQELNALVPFLGQVTSELVVPIDAGSDYDNQLKIQIHPDAYLYINGRMQSVPESGLVKWPLDSLAKLYGDQMTMRIYGQPLEPKKIETLITYTPKRKISVTGAAREYFDVRMTNSKSNYLILTGIIVFGIVLGFRTGNYRLFSEYFNGYQLLKVRQRFDAMVSQSLFSSANLSYYLLYGILIAGGVYLLGLSNSFLSSWGLPLLLTAIIVGMVSTTFLLLKYPLVVLIGLLFQTRKMQDIHYMMYVRYSMNMSVLFFMACFINGLADNVIVNQYALGFQIGFFILFLGRVVMIFLALNSRLIFYKLHLFTYLCSTEIFPLILFWKYLHS